MQAVGRGHQHLVARRVTEAVVDDLEVVEVQEEDSGQAGPPFEPAQGQTQAVEEQRPVRQAGEGVVQRLMDELLFGVLSLGDITSHHDVPEDGRVVAQIGHAVLQPAP